MFSAIRPQAKVKARSGCLCVSWLHLLHWLGWFISLEFHSYQLAHMSGCWVCPDSQRSARWGKATNRLRISLSPAKSNQVHWRGGNTHDEETVQGFKLWHSREDQFLAILLVVLHPSVCQPIRKDRSGIFVQERAGESVACIDLQQSCPTCSGKQVFAAVLTWTFFSSLPNLHYPLLSLSRMSLPNSENASTLESAMQLMIQTFHKYSGNEGDKYTLSRAELKEMLTAELGNYLGVRRSILQDARITRVL